MNKTQINERIPLRPSVNHKVISLLGSTGAGKTTFLRKLLGINSEEDIPPTSSSRTTTYTFEVVVQESDNFACCFSFIHDELLKDFLQDCIFSSIYTFVRTSDYNKTFRKLLEDSTQSFRLKYILGNIEKENPNNPFRKKYENLISECAKELADACKILEVAIEIKRPNKEDESILYEELAKTNAFIKLDKEIQKDIEKKKEELFNVISEKTFFDSSLNYFHTTDKNTLFSLLDKLIGNKKENWGTLLTPLIESVRVSGKFKPDWLTHYPQISIIDAKGFGHSDEKEEKNISIDYVNSSTGFDYILLVDTADKPFFAATKSLVKGLVHYGLQNKLLFIFTKFDCITGSHIKSLGDKKEHVTKAFEQVCDDFRDDDNLYLIADQIEDMQEKHFFYFSYLDQDEYPKVLNEELRKLLSTLSQKIHINPDSYNKKKIILKKSNSTYNLESELSNVLNLLLEAWKCKLNLHSSIPGQASHWTQIKALTRRMAWAPTAESSTYLNLTPIDDFAAKIQQVVFNYISENEISQSILTEFTQFNSSYYAKQKIKEIPLEKWKFSYDLKGAGSTRVRSSQIITILENAYKESIPEVMKKLTELEAYKENN